MILALFLTVVRADTAHCYALPVDNICGPAYAGYPVDMPVDQWSAFINVTYGNITNKITAISSGGQCDQSLVQQQVQSLQYQVSMACSLFISKTIANGCKVTTDLDQNGPTLCYGNCFAGVNSLNNLLQNSKCQNPNLKVLQDANTYCHQIQSQADSQAPSCVKGATIESTGCGFLGTDIANVQCSGNITDANTKQCCQNYLSSLNGNSGDKSTKIIIVVVSAVVGVCLLVALGIGLYCYRKGRSYDDRPRNLTYDEAQKRRDFYNAASPNYVESPSSPYSSAFNQAAVKQPQPVAYSPSTVLSNQKASSVVESAVVNIGSATIDQIISPATVAGSAVGQEIIPEGSKKFKVIHPYSSTMDDELTLVVGKSVYLLKEYDDGWGLGFDPETGSQGALPMVCIEPDFGVAVEQSKEEVRISKRLSSIPNLPKEDPKERSKVPFSQYIEELDEINGQK
ncbi:hypothetical protein HDV06_006509 [Boothiomyces sp. JEL0866]|nr:hypothetical protein HDV06_006509 [Boothiomyces sp. JEL0866]